MSTLMQASRQWANRPAEERFTTLTDMRAKMHAQRAIARASVVSSRQLRAVPDGADGLLIEGPAGRGFAPTNWAFGQLAGLEGAPGAYVRELPAPLAADCVNYGLQVTRDAHDIGVLVDREGQLRAATGPRYGRIWNSDIVDALADRFGDGATGQWRVPGIGGQALSEVTSANTQSHAGQMKSRGSTIYSRCCRHAAIFGHSSFENRHHWALSQIVRLQHLDNGFDVSRSDLLSTIWNCHQDPRRFI